MYATNKTSIKNSMKSSSKDERKCKSDTSSNSTENDIIIDNQMTHVDSNKIKAKGIGAVTLKKTINKNSSSIGFRPTKSNMNQRAKWSNTSGKKKASKYHWSGTFSDRSKRYKSLYDRKYIYLLRDSNRNTCDALTMTTTCNNNSNIFKDKQPVTNTNIYHSNEFASNDRVFKSIEKTDKQLFNNNYQSPINNNNHPTEDIDLYNNIKTGQENNIKEDMRLNYDIYSDRNINLRYRMTQEDEKPNAITENVQKNDFYVSNKSTNFTGDNKFSSISVREDLVSCNIFECCRNSAKCWVNSKVKDKTAHFNKQAADSPPIVRPFYRKLATFIFVVIKNIILLSFLPIVYITFIIYVQSKQE